MAKKADVIAWLDERGWPHDPYDMTEEQRLLIRHRLNICGHRAGRGGKRYPCAKPPMANGRCKHAGGKSLKGMEHPNWKGKGRSRYMPAPLLELYESVLEETGTIREDVAMTDSRIALLLRDLEIDSPPERWDDLGKWFELRRRQLDTLSKIESRDRNVLTAEQAVMKAQVLAYAFTDAIERTLRQQYPELADHVRREAAERYFRLMGRRSLPDSPSGHGPDGDGRGPMAAAS